MNGFNWKDPPLIRKMNAAIKHRGPDDEGFFVDEGISLGNVRLSIIDLSAAGRQPMTNEDETIWLVYNGEVYNHELLRTKLQDKGHRFKSRTDTEVILHLYEEFGADCVTMLHGMWAFALYDAEEELLLLSRDRFGIKPLYYYWNGEKISFSSEIKGILACGIDRIPNDNSVYEYLSSGVTDSARETFFQNVFRLMPGENLLYRFSTKSIELKKWYSVCTGFDANLDADEGKVAKHLRHRFTDTVRSHLGSDVPVGSCLSGGIDSSSIVCVMRLLEPYKRIDTFSLVFPGLGIDESRYVDEVSTRAGIESHKMTIDPSGFVQDLRDLVWTQEEPFESLSVYGQYRLMRLAHDCGIKVLLDGQGGDETMAGYPKYYCDYAIEVLMELRFSALLQVMNWRRCDLPQILKQVAIQLMNRRSTTRKILLRLKSRRLKHLKHPLIPSPSSSQPTNAFGGLRKAQIEDLRAYVPRLLRYEDKNSMRWGVETRVPFLDHSLTEYSIGLSSEHKIRNGITKHCFRKAMKGIVPELVLNRSTKIGFVTPDSIWMREGPLYDVCQTAFSSDSFKSRPYWRHTEVTRLLQEHRQNRKNHAQLLWRLLNVEIWHKVFIDSDCNHKS